MRGLAPLISAAGIGLLTTAAGLIWKAHIVAALGFVFLLVALLIGIVGRSDQGVLTAAPTTPVTVEPLDDRARVLQALRQAITSARAAGWRGVGQETAKLDAALTATLTAFGMPGWRISVEGLTPERTILKVTIKYAETVLPYLELGQVERAKAKGQEYIQSVVG